MNAATTSGQGEDRGSRLRSRLVPILILVVVTGISIGLFFFIDRQKVEQLGNYRYLGVFVVSLLSNATVILPVPGILVIFPYVANLNPVFLGLVGAAGGTLGEITGYMVGYSGRRAIKRGRTYERVEGWMKRWGAWTIFVFAAVPILPFDVAGVVAGALRFPVWKFLLLAWAGKSLKYVLLMLASVWGWELVLPYLSCT